MKVLLVRLSSLGDVVMTFPLASDLAAVQGSELHWVVNEAYRELVGCHPAVHRVHAYPGNGFWPTVKQLRAEQFDIVIDGQGLFKSALLGKAAGGRQLVGLDLTREPVGWLYDRKFPAAGWGEHAVSRYRRLATAVRKPADSPCQYGIVVPEQIRATITALLQEQAAGKGPLLVCNPHSRWQSKRWPTAHWEKLLTALPGCRRVIIGSESEREHTAQLSAAVPGSINLAGQLSLPALWELIGRAALVITNDSGPQHIAAAQQKPLLVLFGPTDPGRTGPGPAAGDAAAVVQAGWDCQPCFKRRCPGQRCMTAVTVDTALAALHRLLPEVVG